MANGRSSRRRTPTSGDARDAPRGVGGAHKGPSGWLGRVPRRRTSRGRLPSAVLLPMQLEVGDRLADETGEWEVIGRPYTTAGGKDARVRVQRVGKPGGTEIRIWRAHERVSVKRASAKEGK
jgi:hypothetical protein